jgi:hypothetical protein
MEIENTARAAEQLSAWAHARECIGVLRRTPPSTIVTVTTLGDWLLQRKAP